MALSKRRVDVLLVERGHFESRAKAAAAVLAGDVMLASGGRRVEKPGQMLDTGVELRVADRGRYVSRGGVKLENALAAFPDLSVSERRALDAGASTGGFTDCLLRRGAAHVIAADVAYGELNWSLREDQRVTVIERRNLRDLRPDELPYRPDLIVADLSFISLTKVLPALARCAAGRFDMLALVKPQFEVGRERIGKGGVVRDRPARVDAVAGVARFALAEGLVVLGAASSGLPGPAGNRETFLRLAESGRAECVHDVQEMAEKADQPGEGS